jgi:hypothetical protein
MPERFAEANDGHWERHILLKELDDILIEQRVVASEIRQTISEARTIEEAEKAAFDNGLALKFEKLQQEFMECLGKLARHQEEKSE